MSNGIKVLAIMSLSIFGGNSIAQEAPPIEVQTVAEKEEVFINGDGEEETRLVPAATVIPGDQVIYTVTFTNNGDDAAENVVITDPIPEQTQYVEGSAFGPGMDITFSIDGGQSFATTDSLTVSEPNGSVRPARAEEYTHVRWAMRSRLEPGSSGFARFRVVLN